MSVARKKNSMNVPSYPIVATPPRISFPAPLFCCLFAYYTLDLKDPSIRARRQNFSNSIFLSLYEALGSTANTEKPRSFSPRYDTTIVFMMHSRCGSLHKTYTKLVNMLVCV